MKNYNWKLMYKHACNYDGSCRYCGTCQYLYSDGRQTVEFPSEHVTARNMITDANHELYYLQHFEDENEKNRRRIRYLQQHLSKCYNY